jgi:hypothetical protein
LFLMFICRPVSRLALTDLFWVGLYAATLMVFSAVCDWLQFCHMHRVDKLRTKRRTVQKNSIFLTLLQNRFTAMRLDPDASNSQLILCKSTPVLSVSWCNYLACLPDSLC